MQALCRESLAEFAFFDVGVEGEMVGVPKQLCNLAH